MNNQSLTINFNIDTSSGSSVSSTRFVRLEQILPEPDIATLGEVAELLESLYDIDPCTDIVTQPEEGVEVINPPFSFETFEQVIANQFKLPVCSTDTAGNWDTQVKVIISNIGDSYRLNLSNGMVTRTVVTEEVIRLNIDIDKESGTLLQYPILGRSEDVFQWNGSVINEDGTGVVPPEIVQLGNSLNWDGEFTGSLTVEYMTRYDLVDVLVYGEVDYSLGKCTATCFYDGLVDSLELEQPEVDEDEESDVSSFCLPEEAPLEQGSGSVDFVKGEPKPWWIIKRMNWKCQCSGEYSHYTYSNEPTQEDEDGNDYRFPAKIEDEFGGYIDCGEINETLHSEEFYIETCCESPPDTNFKEDPVYGLPRCVTLYRKNGGGKPFEREEEYKDRYGSQLRLIGVTPEDGDCGVIKTTQVIDFYNCCDGVSVIEWDSDSSPEVLPSNSGVTVYINGGIAPYTWTISSNNVFFSNTLKKIKTTYPFVNIYANSDFCGAASIKVTDGCSTVNEVLRSDLGSWYYLNNECELAGDFAGNAEGLFSATRIHGKYKQIENVVRNVWSRVVVCETGEMPFSPIDVCYETEDNDSCVILKTSLLEEDRPTGWEQSTCMTWNMGAVMYGYVNYPYSYSFLYDGGWSGEGGITAYHCISEYPEYNRFGSTTYAIAAIINTTSLLLYEWRC